MYFKFPFSTNTLYTFITHIKKLFICCQNQTSTLTTGKRETDNGSDEKLQIFCLVHILSNVI